MKRYHHHDSDHARALVWAQALASLSYGKVRNEPVLGLVEDLPCKGGEESTCQPEQDVPSETTDTHE